MDSEDLNRKKYNKVKHGLPSKKFEARDSLLTDLLENVHIRAIYYFAWIVVVTSQLRFLLHNYFTHGRFGFNLELFKICFSKPYQILYIWVCMFLAALLPYLGFALWATIRNKIRKLSISLFDQLSLTIFILYFATYTCFFTFIIHKNDFKPAAALLLTLELVRLKMKFYAFVRSNVPRARKFTPHNKDDILYPSVSKYLYFLFAPTLIYQDEYPRSKSIRWRRVAEHFANFGGSVLLTNIIVEHCITHFVIFSRNPFKWSNFLVLVVEFTPVSGMMMLLLNYLLFHCWVNAFAEMLRFSDRLFYKDFWTCTSFERFFKTWNGVVKGWLYVYVYKDFYEIVWPNNKFFAKVMVLTISALYHEFFMGISFNLFPQFLFVMFFLLSLIITGFFYGKVVGNLVYLLSSALGTSVLVCAFGTRYYYENTMK